MAEKKALIVDDDYANRSLWELVLSDRGYDVMMAENTADGRAMISEDVSLYLIDYHLPDGRGTEVISKVREQSPTSLVVMVSMDDDADVIREAMRAGGNIFMVKPASPSVMSQLLNEIESGELTPDSHTLINRHGRRSYSAH